MAKNIAPESKVAISNVIAALRNHAAMTTREFGDTIGVTAKQVRRYEAAEAVPPQSRLKRIFHIGLKIAAPFIHQLPGYVPAILTVEAISEITEAVRREREADKEESERIEKLATKVAEQVETACKAREDKERQQESGSKEGVRKEDTKFTDLDSVTVSSVKFPADTDN